MLLGLSKNRTPGQRNRKEIIKLFNLKKKKILSRGYIPKAGKDFRNHKLMQNRIPGKRNKIVKINIKLWWFRRISVVSSYLKLKFKSSLVGLLKFANGSLLYSPILWGHLPGDYIRLFHYNTRFTDYNLVGNYTFGSFLKRDYVISNVIPISRHRPIYARAAGTFCKVFEHIEGFNIILIILPTGQRKYIHKTTIALVGRNSNWELKYGRKSGAGFNINLGKKQTVRGVAKNPVDHPNGGRTKTKVPKKSLWGWVAKKNK